MFRAYFRRKPWASRAYGGAAAILVLLLAQLKVALTINHLHRGRKGLSPSPPSEPCRRFSRTRLSSRWLPHRD
jgi:hypothetical protein